MWLTLHLKCCRNTQSATRHQSVPSQPGNYYPRWTDLFQLKCCPHSEALSAPLGGRAATSLGGPVWSLTLPPTDPTWVWNEGRSQSRGYRGQKNKKKPKKKLIFLTPDLRFPLQPLRMSSLNPGGISLNSVPGSQNHRPSPADPHQLLPEAL